MPIFRIENSITFDTKLYTLTKDDDGVEKRLSKKETEVLAVLCIHCGATVTRQFLFDNAWENGTGSDGHLNRVILLLRRKFDSLSVNDAIKTIPKVGYVLNEAIQLTDKKHILNSAILGLGVITESGVDAQTQRQDELAGREEFTSPIAFIQPEPSTTDEISGPHKRSKKNKMLDDILERVRRPILILAMLTIFGITLFGFWFEFNPGTSENKQTRSLVVYSTLIKNVLLNSAYPIDSEIMMGAKKILSDWNNNSAGKYYVSISDIAVSILHVSNNTVALSKKIYVNEGHDPLTLLQCALKIESPSDEKIVENYVGKVHVNKGTAVKTFTSEVISGCNNIENAMKLSIITSINTAPQFSSEEVNQKFFHASLNLWSSEKMLLLGMNFTGMKNVGTINGKPSDRWEFVSHSVRTFDAEAVADLLPAMKLMSHLGYNRPITSLKLDEGVYYSDILGGTILSTK